jgi:hypothetical protein
MEEIFSFIGKVVAYGGGTAALAYVIFMFLGQKWIEEKFAERLESYKHAQERELERYRHQVNVLFSRVTKIHEKEIEVLPEIWQKLQNALGYVAKITSPLQFGPDFHNMTEEEFQEFLKKSNLTEAHKEALEKSRDRNAFYMKTIFWYDLQEAKSAVREFHNFMLYNRIFLSKDLKQEFQEIDKLLSSSLTQREIGEQARDWKLISEGYKGLGETAERIVARIEKLVQKRLEFGRATPTIENNAS